MCVNETDHELKLQTLEIWSERGILTIKGVAESAVSSRWLWLLVIKDLLKLPDLKNWGGEAELCGSWIWQGGALNVLISMPGFPWTWLVSYLGSWWVHIQAFWTKESECCFTQSSGAWSKEHNVCWNQSTKESKISFCIKEHILKIHWRWKQLLHFRFCVFYSILNMPGNRLRWCTSGEIIICRIEGKTPSITKTELTPLIIL